MPTALVTLAPCWWYSRADPSVYNDVDGPRWLLRWMQWLPRFLVNHYIGRSLRAFCGAIGAPYRRDHYFRALAEADLNLGLWPAAFRGQAADDPARATLCGFPWDDADGGALSPELARFLDGGEPPLVVGLGSSVKAAGDDVYREIGAACRALGCRALLIGARPDAAAGLDGVMAVESAPYRLVFPRARAVVHHGGIGTLAEGLRAGRPTAIVPFANDQFDNARRVRALGVSLTWSRKALRGARAQRAIAQLVGDEGLRARAAELGARVSAEPNGAAVAARVLTGR